MEQSRADASERGGASFRTPPTDRPCRQRTAGNQQRGLARSCPRRVPPAPGQHKSARVEPLPSRANLAQDIAVFEIAFSEFEHGRVANRADLQPSDIGAAEGY